VFVLVPFAGGPVFRWKLCPGESRWRRSVLASGADGAGGGDRLESQAHRSTPRLYGNLGVYGRSARYGYRSTESTPRAVTRREAYEVLSLAGVYPETLVERHQRVARPWARFLANFVPQDDGLPDRIDVSLSATDQLVHTPSEPARYSG
jgi:hypothetical protein